MKVVAIIAEYNPFHMGHYYQIQQIKKELQADYIIVLMSGNYVQRGLPAIFDKYTRAHMALSCGADLVLELPIYYALGSAEYFAKGAVSILEALHVVDYLHFGSECGDIALLQYIASILVEEPPYYKDALQNALKSGLAYPAARKTAFSQYINEVETDQVKIDNLLTILDSPNNILGIEYCKAILTSHSSITPVTILREGAGYQEETLSDNILPSALSLRKAFEGNSDYAVFQPHMPQAAYEVLLQHKPVAIRENDFSQMLHYQLIRDCNLQQYVDIPSDLADKILKNVGKFTDLQNYCDLIKSKNYTYTRISRSLFHILLNIQTSFMKELSNAGFAYYARMLGFRTNASPLLSAIKQKSAIPLISKLADAHLQLDDIGNALLEHDILAANIYQIAVTGKTGSAAKSEFQQQIIRI